MEKSPSGKKLIKAINILIVVFWCLFYSNTSHFNTKTKLDVVVCVNGNHNVLKFTFTLKVFLFEKQKCNYLNILFLLFSICFFSPISIFEIALKKFVTVSFTKNQDMFCFK